MSKDNIIANQQKNNPAFLEKKENVLDGEVRKRLSPQHIDDNDDDDLIIAKRTIHKIDVYNCVVKNGADGLNHVPKRGIPAAELVMLQYIHGSELIVDIKLVKEKFTIQAHDIQIYLRDYLGQYYSEAKVDALWGNALAGKELPLVINDLARTGAIADQQRARTLDDAPKRIA